MDPYWSYGTSRYFINCIKSSPVEIIVLVLAVGLVWATELINTVIEKIMDLISVEKNPQIKIIKDMSAAAVLVASITALIIGCIVFIPKIL